MTALGDRAMSEPNRYANTALSARSRLEACSRSRKSFESVRSAHLDLLSPHITSSDSAREPMCRNQACVDPFRFFQSVSRYRGHPVQEQNSPHPGRGSMNRVPCRSPCRDPHARCQSVTGIYPVLRQAESWLLVSCPDDQVSLDMLPYQMPHFDSAPQRPYCYRPSATACPRVCADTRWRVNRPCQFFRNLAYYCRLENSTKP